MRPSPITLICFVLLVAIVAGCQPAAPPGLSDADRQAIHQTTEQVMKIANESKDWAAYTKLYYAETAIVNPPNAEPVKGHQAIISWLQSSPPLSGFKIEQVEVGGAGGVAYVYGTYSMVITAPGAAPISDKGKYLEIWKRQADRSWKVAIDIFNSDLPLPVPEKK